MTYLEDQNTIRPLAEYHLYREQDGAIIPNYATTIQKRDMQHLAKISSVYNQVTSTLQWELFRRGAEFVPKFVTACVNVSCGKEFEFDTEVCDVCGEATKKPDYTQLIRIKEFVQKTNDNGETLLDVCKQTEFDLDTVDDAYMIVSKDYMFNKKTGEIEGGIIHEIIRADPETMMIIADKRFRLGYNPEGKRVMICPVHRNIMVLEQKKCNACGRKMYPAHFKTRTREMEPIYYMEGEVIHFSKFKPSLVYGYPPFLALYQKVMIELDMDRYVRKSYEKGRPPNGWLFVKTRNTNSLQKAVEWIEKKLEINPNWVYPIGIDSQDNRGQFVNFVNTLNTLQEMQATEFRNMIKREIGAMFGVMPLFQGDLSSSGGLNNEGLQVTVTNRAVEIGQSIYNDKVFPRIMEMFGITDYKYELLPSEEKDEMAELQRYQLELQNASLARQMGLTIELNAEGGFDYSGEISEAPQGLPGMEQPFGLEPTFGEQRFSGEPDSPRKSFAKQEKIPLGPGEKPPKGAPIVVGTRGGRYYIPGAPRGEQPQIHSAQEWAGNLRSWHQTTPTNQPVFLWGRHKEEEKLTEATRKMLQNSGYKVVQVPRELQVTGPGAASEEQRKKFDNFVSNMFKGRMVFDLHSEQRYASANFTPKKRKNNLIALETPHRIGLNAKENMAQLLQRLGLKSVIKARQPAASQAMQEQASHTARAMEKELEKLIKELDYKKRPSKAQIKRVIGKITEKFGRQLKNKTRSHLERAYKKAMDKVEKELNINVVFGESDKEAIKILSNSKVLTSAYSGMTTSLSKKINRVIEQAYKDPELFTLNRMVEAMKKEADDEEYMLRRIARTETTKVSNLARMNSYLQADPEGEGLYKWLGPDDQRTTNICKEIKNKSLKGIPLHALKELVRDTAKKFDPEFEPGDFLPHINCRHTFVKVK